MNNMVQLELAALKRQWVDDVSGQFALLSGKLGRFTFDDLHALFPVPDHANWWGVLAAKLKNQGLIRRVSAVASRRPEANGRLVSVWEVAS